MAEGAKSKKSKKHKPPPPHRKPAPVVGVSTCDKSLPDVSDSKTFLTAYSTRLAVCGYSGPVFSLRFDCCSGASQVFYTNAQQSFLTTGEFINTASNEGASKVSLSSCLPQSGAMTHHTDYCIPVHY